MSGVAVFEGQGDQARVRVAGLWVTVLFLGLLGLLLFLSPARGGGDHGRRALYHGGRSMDALNPPSRLLVVVDNWAAAIWGWQDLDCFGCKTTICFCALGSAPTLGQCHKM